jgi:hypothetical protein
MVINKIIASLVISVMMVSISGCNKPSLKTVLIWGKEGLAEVCQPGQDTLPTVVCSRGDKAINLAIAIADHDTPATQMAVREILADAIKDFPDLGIYFGFLLNPLPQ